MDKAKLRARWAHKQGLDGSLDETSPAAVLARTGWARSVGGVNPVNEIVDRRTTNPPVVRSTEPQESRDQRSH